MREEERREDYWLTSPINLLLCYVTSNLRARSSHVTLLIKSHTTVFYRDYRGGDQTEAKNMLFGAYNRNANQIICRKRGREGNDLIPCTTVWWLTARSKKVLTRAQKTKVHCYSYSSQIRTLSASQVSVTWMVDGNLWALLHWPLLEGVGEVN